MVFELKETEKAERVFEGWQETMIWSCLQKIMGKIYTDSLDNPVSAMALLADFCFFAGKPDAELVQYWPGQYGLDQAAADHALQGAAKPACCEEMPERPGHTAPDGFSSESPWGVIMVPQNRGWGEMIEHCCGKWARKVTRYAFKKEPDAFDKKKLQAAADSLPDGYTMKMMDEELFLRCRKIPWCRDWVSQYGDYAMYQQYGLGAVVLKGREPVSGASSYTSYRGGIEIEIDTREDYRRRGLACACGAKLILECLERGWYPSWDAQNKWSAALAQKLGYHFDGEYTAYEVQVARENS